MAKEKKSFILYCDLIHQIDHLTNEEKGILLTHLIEYVNDKKPILTDRVLLGVWKPIQMQLKRDLKKFEDVKQKRALAGKRSAEIRKLSKKKQNSTNSTSVESVEQTLTNSTVNDNDNDNVITINSNSNIDFNNNHEYYKTECKKSPLWIEHTCRNTKLKPEQIPKALDDFNSHLISDGARKQNLTEYKSHFVRWVRKLKNN